MSTPRGRTAPAKIPRSTPTDVRFESGQPRPRRQSRPKRTPQTSPTPVVDSDNSWGAYFKTSFNNIQESLQNATKTTPNSSPTPNFFDSVKTRFNEVTAKITGNSDDDDDVEGNLRKYYAQKGVPPPNFLEKPNEEELERFEQGMKKSPRTPKHKFTPRNDSGESRRKRNK